jgi:hypothetical protein
MGSLRVVWQFKDEIIRHRLFFEDGLDIYEEIALIKMFERVLESKEIDFYTGFDEYTDEQQDAMGALIVKIAKYQEVYGDVYVNVSEASGTSCVLLGAALLPLGIKFVSYNDIEHEITITDMYSHTTVEAKRDLGIAELFLYRGFAINIQYNKEYLVKHAKDYKTLYKDSANYFNIQAKLYRSNTIDKKNTLFEALLNIGAVDEYGNLTVSKNRLHGGTFEEFIGALTTECGFDDVVCGLEIYWGGRGTELKNEFDVLALYKNRVFLIECKMKSKIDTDELTYKYDSLRKYIAPQTRASIVHLNVGLKKDTQISKRTANRCALSGIGIYSVKDVVQEEFNEFINSAFFKDHPSDIAWTDVQAVNAGNIIYVKCDENKQETKAKIIVKTKMQSLYGLEIVQSQNLPIIYLNKITNPTQYFHIAVTNLFRQFANWSHKNIHYSAFRDELWHTIIDFRTDKMSLQLYNALVILENDSKFLNLKSIVIAYLNFKPYERASSNLEFIKIVDDLSTLYEQAAL